MSRFPDRPVRPSQHHHAIGCSCADRWVPTHSNGAQTSSSRGRFFRTIRSTPALWRSVHPGGLMCDPAAAPLVSALPQPTGRSETPREAPTSCGVSVQDPVVCVCAVLSADKFPHLREVTRQGRSNTASGSARSAAGGVSLITRGVSVPALPGSRPATPRPGPQRAASAGALWSQRGLAVGRNRQHRPLPLFPTA
jgi:hypothetical protein